MKRTTLLAGTALAILPLLPAAGHAATCTLTGLEIVCGELDSDPISSSDDGVSVTVNSGASVVSDNEGTTSIELEGDDVSITNNGTITQSDVNESGRAITGEGNGLTIVNNGTIESGDRAIEMRDGASLSVTNAEGATITSRRQAIRAGTDIVGATTVINDGTIISSEGRALQLRTFGASVINNGVLMGAEEVVEARGDFFLENRGTISLINGDIPDEDGVQLSGGEVQNYGFISGSDDGVDLDEGFIFNRAGATILSTAPDQNDNGGIDIDEIYSDGVSEDRAPTGVTIINEGTIEGPNAINTDIAATSSLDLTNRGVLRGRGGTSINLAPDMGDSTLNIEGASEIFGDVLFGSGNDTVTVSDLSSGLLSTGLFDGDLGTDTVEFDFALSLFSSFDVTGDRIDLSFLSDGVEVLGTFLSFESWIVDGQSFTSSSLSAAINDVPAVPLPASLPLVLFGFAGFGLLRRKA